MALRNFHHRRKILTGCPILITKYLTNIFSTYMACVPQFGHHRSYRKHSIIFPYTDDFLKQASDGNYHY
uniref:Uncharacterized protein n=1 Tax=Glossina palpalis gambiensis TaxID=67801 RepID=A0A1B0C2T3_9MUSC